jgi:hypothetical protein
VTGRILRDAAVICLLLAGVALAIWPGEWRRAAGVMGGGLLMGLSAWAIRGAVDGLIAAGPGVGGGRRGGSWALVKFFTRHAMLALVAYGMMVRLHLDPVGMLVGVTSLALAAAVEAIRQVQRVS